MIKDGVFFRKHYGHWKVDVELGKKENRSGNMIHITYGEYLDRYNTSDIYLVSHIKPGLKHAGDFSRFLLVDN